MQSIDTTKPATAMAQIQERAGAGWRRQSRIRVRVLALLGSVLAAGLVFGVLNGRLGLVKGETKPQQQLLATIDLRIGNPAAAAERGEAQARADIEAGLLQLQVFGPEPARADARPPKQRHGITWLRKADAATPLTQAQADGYNRVMRAEIERRHGREALERLLREQRRLFPQADSDGLPLR